MKTMTDSIIIHADPKEIFDALLHIFSSGENYRMWHKDHKACIWLKGKPFEKGSVLYAEEYLHGKLHQMKFISTRFVRNEVFEYKLLFPFSIVCPGGSFVVERERQQCIFTASLDFRFDQLLFRWAKTYFNGIQRHMKEEGENLKYIVENKTYLKE